jgi:hypothetical protein
VIAVSAVPGEYRHPLGKSIVISHNASGVAVGAQVFTWAKRKRRSVSKRSNVSPPVSGKMRLATILHDPKIVSSGDRHDRIHIGRLTVKMDWNNAHCGGGDLSLDIVGIDRERFLICVTEYDPAARLRDCFRC